MLTVETIWDNIDKVRGSTPVVHSITNYVVMNSTANALLCAGASPIMAHAKEELEELINLANCLVLNIGTLSSSWIESMHLGASIAAANYKPIILDPVGAGASAFRTNTAISLLEEGGISAIRGNASEIMALAGAGTVTRGVDSSHETDEAEESAQLLAKKYRCVVSVSGCTDIITNGETTYYLSGGSELMTLVTGMGCTATALCGAHLSITDDSLAAIVSGMGCMAAAGAIAAEKSSGPGTFSIQFLDSLQSLAENDVKRHVSLEVQS
ncbi:MAG: hydroxyethylthiazole kinase [Desulfovibrionales bacterium]|nr:hydroxyethylthiazole kinase [Desulfovibrionales bacterium]